ncbi:hypothetical protein, partial [Mucilaginibacter sp. 5C4]
MNRMGDGMGSASEMGAGMGAGNRAGMQGDASKGVGMAAGLADVASGTMTDEQKASLTAMAAEEKVAHDLHVAFAEKYDAAVFSRIARSET